jgi:hypothetical protein
MQEKFKDYRKLIEQVLTLQQKLFQALEGEIEIAPDPGLFEFEMYKKLKAVLRPDRSVTEILRSWPKGISILPLVAWVKPRKGVFYCEDQYWLFNIHGFLEVRFCGLSSGLEASSLERLKAGNMDALHDLSECKPLLSTAYLRNGRTDGLSDQLMYDFSRSTGSKFAELSEEDHEKLLDEMIRQGLLVLPPKD